MTVLEIIASVFGFLCVWFCIVRNVWSWPTGLVQVILFIAVFYQAKLYADMALHVVYVGMQIFGWIAWLKSPRSILPNEPRGSSNSNFRVARPEALRKSRKLRSTHALRRHRVCHPKSINPKIKVGRSTSAESLVVRSLSLRGIATSILATVLLTVVFSLSLIHWTDAELPIADSFVAAASLVAQFLLATRYLENWIYWIVIDTVGVGLFAYKELYPTAILYALFWAMAIVGFVHWLQAFRRQRIVEANLS